MEFLSGYLEFLCGPGASFSRKFGIKRRPAFGDRMIGTAGVRFIDILELVWILVAMSKIVNFSLRQGAGSGS